MIRIIKSVEARSLDAPGGAWAALPLVRGTGVLETTQKPEDAGQLGEARLSAVLSSSPGILSDSLELLVFFCGGGSVRLGTADLPVRLEVSRGDSVRVSCAWKRPIY